HRRLQSERLRTDVNAPERARPGPTPATALEGRASPAPESKNDLQRLRVPERSPLSRFPRDHLDCRPRGRHLQFHDCRQLSGARSFRAHGPVISRLSHLPTLLFLPRIPIFGEKCAEFETLFVLIRRPNVANVRWKGVVLVAPGQTNEREPRGRVR